MRRHLLQKAALFFFLLFKKILQVKTLHHSQGKNPWGRSYCTSAGSSLCTRRAGKHSNPGCNHVPNRPGPQATGRNPVTQLLPQTPRARNQKLFVKPQGTDSVGLGQTPVPPGSQKDVAPMNAAPEEHCMSQEHTWTLHTTSTGMVFLPAFLLMMLSDHKVTFDSEVAQQAR